MWHRKPRAYQGAQPDMQKKCAPVSSSFPQRCALRERSARADGLRPSLISNVESVKKLPFVSLLSIKSNTYESDQNRTFSVKNAYINAVLSDRGQKNQSGLQSHGFPGQSERRPEEKTHPNDFRLGEKMGLNYSPAIRDRIASNLGPTPFPIRREFASPPSDPGPQRDKGRSRVHNR